MSRVKSSANNKNDWLVGLNPLIAILEADPTRILNIVCIQGEGNTARFKQAINLAERYGVAIEYVAKDKFNKRFAEFAIHQNVAAKVKPLLEKREKDLIQWLDTSINKRTLILILDQVKDPHNFGAILRTAEAAGVDAVIVSNKNSAPITAIVRKVSSGAVETINLFRVNNLARAIQAIKECGIWVVGTSDSAQTDLYSYKFDGAHAIVMGSEGSGLRRLTSELCDNLVVLPMSGAVSSLNVSVAAGVVLYEAVRQRQSVDD